MESIDMLYIHNNLLAQEFISKANVYEERTRFCFRYLDKNPELLTDVIEEDANRFWAYLEILHKVLFKLEDELNMHDVLEAQTHLYEDLLIIIDSLNKITLKLDNFYSQYIPEVE
tara:strand:- start:16248 stop:16592 length:345 start_codon:yes stop_codon:yes gene_type:complete